MSSPSDETTPLDAAGGKDTPALASSQSQPPRRILLVEDDTGTRRLYSEALTGSGYQVDTAEDGEAGWQALQAGSRATGSYDLLITDNNMPKLSGVELIQKLRAGRMALPVILASGSAPLNTGWLQLAAVLPKPFSLDELVRTVKAVLHTANNDCEKVNLPGRG